MQPIKRNIPEQPVVDHLANFIYKLSFQDLPSSVIDAMKQSLLDSVGVAILGADTPQAKMLVSEVISWGGAPEATLLGSSCMVPLPAAGLVSGLLCHSLDFDDTHLKSIVHPSSCIVPAMLGLAEVLGLTGREAVTVAVIGYEIIARLGIAASGQFQIRGIHATSVCGAIAVAAMTARAMGGSEIDIKNAIGCAASMASGILEPAHDGTWTKLLQTGWAVHGGFISGRLGIRGFSAPHRALDGEFGFYASTVGNDVDYSILTAPFFKNWETENISIKLYPTCHHIHAFLDAIIEVLHIHPLIANNISYIELTVGAPQSRIICEPWQEKITPKSGHAARFSLPYAVAVTIFDGMVNINQYDENLQRYTDKSIISLMKLIRYQPEPNPDFPKKLGGKISFFLKNGEVIEIRKENCRGSVEGQAISAIDVKNKFKDNAGFKIGQNKSNEIIEFIQNFENNNPKNLITMLSNI
ncbi:MAG: MmgE/PrpD family protein [Betaproteobacteria bacterium]